MVPPLVRWAGATAGSCPVQHNNRWTFLLVRGGPPSPIDVGVKMAVTGGGHGQGEAQRTVPVREWQQGQTLLSRAGRVPRRADHAPRGLPRFGLRAGRHHQGRVRRSLRSNSSTSPNWTCRFRCLFRTSGRPRSTVRSSALDDDDEEAFDTALSDVVSRVDTIAVSTPARPRRRHPPRRRSHLEEARCTRDHRTRSGRLRLFQVLGGRVARRIGR